ncbi:MAG: hypothetical protein C4539_04160 [Ignavibacteriales bacterium]|nr:MAG: hypothetical protein C4539_04160 [Ignavibacteriales bacterium]
MKKKKNNLLFRVLALALIAGLLIIVQVSLVREIKSLTKDINTQEQFLITKKNFNTSLLVEVQKLEDGSRIIPIAEQRLGLIKYSEPNLSVEINSDELEQINHIIEKKYE